MKEIIENLKETGYESPLSDGKLFADGNLNFNQFLYYRVT